MNERYNANNLTVLHGLEPVRERPGMYIGSTDTVGLHHLVWEIVDNAVDEANEGYGKNIYVTIHDDGSLEVQDQGRGIPYDYNSKESSMRLTINRLVACMGLAPVSLMPYLYGWKCIPIRITKTIMPALMMGERNSPESRI